MSFSACFINASSVAVEVYLIFSYLKKCQQNFQENLLHFIKFVNFTKNIIIALVLISLCSWNDVDVHMGDSLTSLFSFLDRNCARIGSINWSYRFCKPLHCQWYIKELLDIKLTVLLYCFLRTNYNVARQDLIMNNHCEHLLAAIYDCLEFHRHPSKQIRSLLHFYFIIINKQFFP